MLSFPDIKNKYIQLYSAMREYIWPYEVTYNLAQLEVSLFEQFPDLEKCRKKLNTLKVQCKPLFKEDEELEKSFDELEELLNSSDTMFAYLTNPLGDEQ